MLPLHHQNLICRRAYNLYHFKSVHRYNKYDLASQKLKVEKLHISFHPRITIVYILFLCDPSFIANIILFIKKLLTSFKALLKLVKSFVLLIWETRKKELYGDQDCVVSGCSCSCPLTGGLTSSACVCGCVVNGVSATAAT